jgi:hypothetical protein
MANPPILTHQYRESAFYQETTHMQTAPTRVRFIPFLFSLAACLLLSPTFIRAQDSPGRFELGGNFTAVRFEHLPTQLGPGVEGDINFGRHFAFDAAYSWLPRGAAHIMTGFFGAKVGTRTKHFGFFGKVRPGFISFGSEEREATEVFDSSGSISLAVRFARLNERALDLGGVVEYYPASHWALRWDLGDLMLFHEGGPTLTQINLDTPGVVTITQIQPGGTFNRFQFSSGIHYRF